MFTKSRDYRTVFANAFGMVFSGKDAKLIFGIAENPGSSEDIEEQIAVFVGPETLKLLGYTISQVIDQYETTTGTIIPLDDAKKQSVNERLSIATPQANPTA